MTPDPDDQLAKAKRARRFEREHEIERQRSAGINNHRPSPRVDDRRHNLQRPAGRSIYGRGYEDDEPTYDPVCDNNLDGYANLTCIVPERDRLGPLYNRRQISRIVQELPTIDICELEWLARCIISTCFRNLILQQSARCQS